MGGIWFPDPLVSLMKCGFVCLDVFLSVERRRAKHDAFFAVGLTSSFGAQRLYPVPRDALEGGEGNPPPLQGAQPMPSRCPQHGKCRPQWHL